MVLVKQKVYVVDDDESVCRALKILLGTYDLDVETFSSSRSFFNAVSKDDPGFLLLDIHMPELDGWETQRMIRESGSKRPVIFISAEKPEVASYRATRAGAVGFLQKPVNAQTLVDLISAASKDMAGVAL
jgi:FixJ family two-component response regulator